MHAYEPIDNIEGLFAPDEFHGRHIGPDHTSEAEMLEKIGLQSRAQLISETVPASSPEPLPSRLRDRHARL